MLFKRKITNMVLISLSVHVGLLSMTSTGLAQGDSYWTTKASMPTARYWFSCGVVDDKIYAVGGVAVEGPALSIMEVYDPVTDTWDTTKADMPAPRVTSTSCVYGGKIYVFGGDSIFKIMEAHPTPTVQIYDPATDTWDTTKRDMPTARIAASACVVNDTIYVIGGGDTALTILNVVEAYDPVTDTWTTKKDMPTARYALSTCVVNGKIYAMGGNKPQGLRTVEEYDPKTDSWTKKADMPIKNGYFGACVVDSMIYTVGGSSPGLGNFTNVFRYNPATDTWDTLCDMPTARYGLGACAVDSMIYAMGGAVDWPPLALSTVEEYNTAYSPLILPDQWFNVYENSAVVGKIYLDTSRWESDSVSYSIIEADPENIFEIDTTTHEILVPDSTKLDYEKSTSWNLLIQAEHNVISGTTSDDGKVHIELMNINDNPPIFNDTIFSIDENSPALTLVGIVSAEDPDGDVIYYEILDGNINNTFSLSMSTGYIRVANPDSLDYETEKFRLFILTIVAKELNGPHTDTGTVTINVTDVYVINIASRSFSSNIKIYPNPSNDLVTIQTGVIGTYTVEITSLNGQKLYWRNFSSNTCKVDLSKFQKGVYFITVKARDYVRTEKIIKQ